VEEPVPIAGQGYKLVFEDDFDTLNSDIWRPPPHHGTVFSSGAVVAAGSILTITAERDHPTRPWVEAWSLGVQQAEYPRYPNALAWQEGYFEVRCRITNDPWTKLAMWFFGLEQQNAFGLPRDCGRLNCEWDMLENGVRAGVNVNGYADVNHVSAVHRNTSSVCDTPNQSTSYNTAGTGLTDWHVWSGKWTATQVTSYLDGVAQGTMLTPDTFAAQPMAFIMTSAPLNYTPAMITQWNIPAPPAAIVTDVDWIRVWQRPPNARRCTLSTPGTTGNYASTPDHPSLRITGDIDIRFEFAPNDTSPTAVQSIINRAISGDWSYQVGLRTNGAIRFTWSANGSATMAADSSALPYAGGERIIMRVTMDVDNGASQRVIRYYTGASQAGPWTEMPGSPVTQAGITSIWAGARTLEVAAQNVGVQEPFAGSIYWAEIRNGIDGQVVARFDARDQTPNDHSFTDETGKLWTVTGAARVVQGIPKPDLYKSTSPLRLT
jgi:hypothetical protein